MVFPACDSWTFFSFYPFSGQTNTGLDLIRKCGVAPRRRNYRRERQCDGYSCIQIDTHSTEELVLVCKQLSMNDKNNEDYFIAAVNDNRIVKTRQAAIESSAYAH